MQSTRERILSAALVLADKEGIEALSMRKLGRELGMQAMSLYHHFANKDAILAEVLDLLFLEISQVQDNDWKCALSQRARSFRTVLLNHPWSVGLLEAQRRPGPHRLKHHDWVLGMLRCGGFSAQNAGRAFWLMDSYVYGSVLQEITTPTDEHVIDDLRSLLTQAAYPHLFDFVHTMKEDDHAFDSAFEFGLELMMNSLASRATYNLPFGDPTY